MHNVDKLDVFYNQRKVGTLALVERHLVAFEYDETWLIDGFSISPLSLPLQKKVFIPKIDPFDGLYGVFADSLPDGWGRLLVDRFMLKKGLNPFEVGNMKRLGIVADSGMGALEYRPAVEMELLDTSMNLDEIARECKRFLKKDETDKLDELFHMGGSSGGARPKVLMNIDGEEWIIKFPSSYDYTNIGEQEYRYSQCARACGIEIMETKLFQSSECAGYFGTKRFDRILDDNGGMKKQHMVSVSGLLETSHRIPNLDYNILMKLTLHLTEEFSEVEKLYRLMCFNVFAHNRDDHSKNFTFIYEDTVRRWKLSPAYDLTYSSSLNGEHATTVNGNGVNPGVKELLEVGENIGIKKSVQKDIIDQVRTYVEEHKICSIFR